MSTVVKNGTLEQDKSQWFKYLLFGIQHALVIVAVPITSVFLVAKALSLSDQLTVNLMSATFLVCGLGTLLQSIGPYKFGARLPFVMIPGGAPIVMFLGIAQEKDLATASGAVILTSLFYFLVLPIFKRFLRFFPNIVIGTLLILVSINLIKIYGGLVVGKPDTANFASTLNIGLAFATIAASLFFARVLKGTLSQLSILLGLICGTILSACLGQMHFAATYQAAIFSFPTLMPFGIPKFDLVATIPLLIFSLISMVEATGQTITISELVGKNDTALERVPSTIRGDALISLLGGGLGTSMIITSGENIGIVRATQIRSRCVTIVAGIILLIISVFTPLAHLANAIPVAVVSGTAIIVFSIIGTIGIDILRRVDLHEKGNMYVLACALTMGLLPILVNGLYANFPHAIQPILNNGLAMGALTAIILNIVFNTHSHTNTYQESK
ncbi:MULTISPECIES: uracil-xanthine permease family protein [unclassified Acinetobacter]|uniref:uracil-xanthine permease family protein n=1 Tax=unclassified Acinetobacter TaxID=196816 RepID=UPI0012506F38|nr:MULTISPECIES: uracil-xanthine permease family protein [unclassified Acinetobacter]